MSTPNPFEAPGHLSVSGDRRMLRLKRIGILSSGIFGAAAGALFGLPAGGFFFLLSLVGVGGMNMQDAGPLVSMGAGAIILAPLMYGFMGFIGGLINAVIYNVVAGLSGGIEMEFSD